ncbi:MAG: hypothetical protein ACFCVF_15680 [Kineosporiaceae bacterium]
MTVDRRPASSGDAPTLLRAMLFLIPGVVLFLLNGVPLLLALAAGELDAAGDSPLRAVARGGVAVTGIVLVVVGARVLRARSRQPH